MRDERSMGAWLIAAAVLLFIFISGSVKPVSEAQAASGSYSGKSFHRPLKVSMSVSGGERVTTKVIYRPVIETRYEVITYQKLVRR
ncbi:MAG TPA: hypothetical protein P5246_02055 [Candidatus Omnitrophota bacterium]|nr:hypothetical protein [Candidatus Omnitrophota bacterium]